MQAVSTDQARALHARLAGILSAEGDAVAVRIHHGIAYVTALTGGHQCRLEVDLGDPDAELVLATKVACFVDRVRHAAA